MVEFERQVSEHVYETIDDDKIPSVFDDTNDGTSYQRNADVDQTYLQPLSKPAYVNVFPLHEWRESAFETSRGSQTTKEEQNNLKAQGRCSRRQVALLSGLAVILLVLIIIAIGVSVGVTSSRKATSQLPFPVISNITTTTTQVNTNNIRPVPVNYTKYNYTEVLHKSILFYEAQRSGKLPSSNRIPWRGDSALDDGKDVGHDLTGGWYDAGDGVKFNFPMAGATTNLAWGLIEYRKAYQVNGELQNMLDCIKWPLDYFIKCHVAKDVLYGQVGNGDIDHAYWGRQEEMTMRRPAYVLNSSLPGSDLAGVTAAAMAAGSIAFRQTDRAYADSLLQHAREIYDFGVRFKGGYSNSITDAAKSYSSSGGYNDELAWAAAWLYRATQEGAYLQAARQTLDLGELSGNPWSYDWADKTAGANLLMYQLTKEQKYKTRIETFLDSWLPGGQVTYTPKGLAWRQKWGSNRYAANVAFLALVAADEGLKPATYRGFAEGQIHYMLGDAGRSFIVGFGENYPLRPAHRASSCPDLPAPCGWEQFRSSKPNPQVLYGALVGGPDQDDSYEDKRSDYVMNQVTCDYNAGFQSAVAGLYQRHIT